MNQTNQNNMSWVVIIVVGVLFFLAFQVHSFLPILIGIPLLVLFMQKKKPEQYYVPSSQDEQTPPTPTLYPHALPARPKESPRWDDEQPVANYPQQLPPMSQ